MVVARRSSVTISGRVFGRVSGRRASRLLVQILPGSTYQMPMGHPTRSGHRPLGSTIFIRRTCRRSACTRFGTHSEVHDYSDLLTQSSEWLQPRHRMVNKRLRRTNGEAGIQNYPKNFEKHHPICFDWEGKQKRMKKYRTESTQ